MDEQLLKKLSEYLSGEGKPMMNDSMSSLERLYARPQMYMTDQPSVDWQQQLMIRSDPAYRENTLRILRGMSPEFVPNQYKGLVGKYSM